MAHPIITAIHIFDGRHVDSVMRKMVPALTVSEEVWLSCSTSALSSLVSHVKKRFHPKVRAFAVSNAWHDWSGFLAFIHNRPIETGLIIANDSIASRRVLSGRSINAVVSAFRNQDHALVGELDCSAESVIIGGQASACWISTYLFGLTGIEIDVHRLESEVNNEVREILGNPEHMFFRYLADRRPSLIRQADLLTSKLGAMCFERRLTQIAIQDRAKIVHAFAGSKLRKVERAMERWRDA